jgi:hypothetical protein
MQWPSSGSAMKTALISSALGVAEMVFRHGIVFGLTPVI